MPTMAAAIGSLFHQEGKIWPNYDSRTQEDRRSGLDFAMEL